MRDRYYKHYKGNVYRFILECTDSETLEPMIVYEAMYGDHQVWVRPKKMFDEMVTLPNGETVKRFTEIPPD